MAQTEAAVPSQLLSRIAAQFDESVRAKQAAKAELGEPIARAARLFAQSLKAGNKALACGNGGSAADSQHFIAELINRFERERPPLAGVALTTDTSTLTSIANDYDYKLVFAKQVRAIGKRGDVLLAISTSGNSGNVVEAVQAAHETGVHVVGLTGNGGGKIAAALSGSDVSIVVPHKVTARIQEVHLLVLHCLCDLVDFELFGPKP